MKKPTYFGSDLLKLPRQDYTTIFILLLTKLKFISDLQINAVDYQQIKVLSSILKKAILDHTQGVNVINFHLKQTIKTPGLSSLLVELLRDVIQFFNTFDKKTQLSPPDLETRIQRQVESQVAISLLQHPSKQMWECVGKVSIKIIDLIKQNAHEPELFVTFLKNINGIPGDENTPIIPFYFSHFFNKGLDEVIKTLEEGNNLADVMLIHFAFMRDALLNLPTPTGDSLESYGVNAHGEFAEYLASFKGNISDLHEITVFFTNYTTMSPIYADRGRKPIFNSILDTHLGIVIHEEDRKIMPTISTAWCPDCICQEADLDSLYTQSLISHEIPYVSGPSGMTSLFSSALTLLGNFSLETEKNYYFLAVLAYMVSGGLHSMHEVLSVAHIRLGLLPTYKTSGANIGNYDSFFALFADDNEVQKNLDTAWSETIKWMSNTFPEACAIKIIETDKKDEDKPAGNWDCRIM